MCRFYTPTWSLKSVPFLSKILSFSSILTLYPPRLLNGGDAPQERIIAAYEAARPRERTAADDEADLREVAAPMAAGDAIERMLLAWKDRDYFRHAPVDGSAVTGE